jgi:hypothetical protein
MQDLWHFTGVGAMSSMGMGHALPRESAAELRKVLQYARETVPIGIYRHRNGSEYVVFSHSLQEFDLVPVVHYYSASSELLFTRTLDDFVAEVKGKPRFVFVRKATVQELRKPFFDALTESSAEEREGRFILCGDDGDVCYQCKRSVTDETATHGVGAGWVCKDKASCREVRDARTEGCCSHNRHKTGEHPDFDEAKALFLSTSIGAKL